MKHKALFALLSITLLLFPILYSSAKGQINPLEGKISGTVIDGSNGQALDNVAVTAGIGSGINQTAITNGTGQYFIGSLMGSLAGMTYNITAAKPGYITQSANVILLNGIDFTYPATQDFTLTPIPANTPTPSSPVLTSTPTVIPTPSFTLASTLPPADTGNPSPTATVPELPFAVLFYLVLLLTAGSILLTAKRRDEH